MDRCRSPSRCTCDRALDSPLREPSSFNRSNNSSVPLVVIVHTARIRDVRTSGARRARNAVLILELGGGGSNATEFSVPTCNIQHDLGASPIQFAHELFYNAPSVHLSICLSYCGKRVAIVLQ